MSERITLSNRLIALSPGVVMLASIAVLGTALVSQFWGGLQPCDLCIYQRWPYVATIVLGAAGLFLAGIPARRIVLILCGAVFLVGGAIAAYHVGVEQHWVQGPAACSGGGEATTIEDLRRQLLATPIVRCDEIAWSMFGISMAGYNVIASVLLAGFALVAAFRLPRV